MTFLNRDQSRERLRRCLLFMPGNSPRKIEKGITLQPDGIIMDLEDGVAASQKLIAREVVTAALLTHNFGHSERMVRINPIGSGLEEADLWAVVPAAPEVIVVPKVSSASHLLWLGQRLNVIEDTQGWQRGRISVLAIIETALGVINLAEIATHDRLIALGFGAEDLAGDIGALRTASGHETRYARQAVVLHAAAFNLPAIDTPHVNLNDDSGLREQAQLARELGYDGKFAIHPSQIEPIQTLFSPSKDEINYARELIAAYEQHQAAGNGVFTFREKMIDTPMLRAAQRVLKRARAAGLLN